MLFSNSFSYNFEKIFCIVIAIDFVAAFIILAVSVIT
jgi:hypothetical protein